MTKIKLNLSKIKLPRIRKFNMTTFLAMLSYLNILVLIPLIAGKNRPFITFHAKQGLALLAVSVVGVFSFYLPVFPWLFTLFVLICIIFGLVNVFTSKERRLPLIGKFV